MRKLSLLVFVCLAVLPNSADAFQIKLPKGYFPDLHAKRLKESKILEEELEHEEIERAIADFVKRNPTIEGVEISHAAEKLFWTRTTNWNLQFGMWFVFLSEWEFNYPSLKKIKWDAALLVCALSYDSANKTLMNGNGQVRLYFKLRREGGLFGKKRIRAEFQFSDYGEAIELLPFGGVSLERPANEQYPESDSIETAVGKFTEVYFKDLKEGTALPQNGFKILSQSATEARVCFHVYRESWGYDEELVLEKRGYKWRVVRRENYRTYEMRPSGRK
ncbi:MAG: hypothetical protein QM715_00750 [Nibricoccus sp.]